MRTLDSIQTIGHITQQIAITNVFRNLPWGVSCCLHDQACHILRAPKCRVLRWRTVPPSGKNRKQRPEFVSTSKSRSNAVCRTSIDFHGLNKRTMVKWVAWNNVRNMQAKTQTALICVIWTIPSFWKSYPIFRRLLRPRKRLCRPR